MLSIKKKKKKRAKESFIIYLEDKAFLLLI